MENYINNVKRSLFSCIREMSTMPWLFVKNPETDFTRKKKLDFETFMKLFISMEGRSVDNELLDFFDFSPHCASASAFNQQRSKILPEAFDYLFHTFTERVAKPKTWNGYRLLACDGTDINIFRNPNDLETYYQSLPTDKGFNQLHLSALYDICSRIYVDGVIQNRYEENEFRACVQMLDRSDLSEKTILIADRGFENYNIFAHAQAKGWKYLIRAKDIHSNGIVSGLHEVPDGVFDQRFSFLLTRRQTKEVKSQPQKYKFMPTCQTFDYLPLGSKETYSIDFRVVRFKISDDSYECIITNLSEDEFSADTIKKLYGMRWGIETSFRELKYAIGLTHFHAKKVPYIKQEIFARLLLYNFCEVITTSIVIEHNKVAKHCYQVNFTRAIFICKEYLKRKELTPASVSQLIQKYILPIRPGRSDPRKVKHQAAVGFLYRVA